ncbi:MAG TPA: hypothetical protein VJ715_16800 [Pyrinomonadaceae bacterium]|nr:hypothetical protein [Pyrinomonadaceae bacterium]
MASTKCRACGLTNFSSAIVCRRCNYPLFGAAAQADSQPAQRRPSRRWILNAVIASIVLAVVLLFAIYTLTLILTTQEATVTQNGWTDFTPEQLEKIGFRYGIGLIIGLLIVWAFFYSRRHNYDV